MHYWPSKAPRPWIGSYHSLVEPIELRDEQVTLSALTPADFPALIAWMNDPTIKRWMPFASYPYTRQDAEWFLDNKVKPGWASGKELTWAIRETSLGGALMPARDTVAIRTERIPGYQPGEVGFALAPAARGRGLATAALKLVLAYAFDPNGLNLETARWECKSGNEASWRVAWRCGFQFGGVWPDDDNEHTPGNWYASLNRNQPLDVTKPWPAGAPILAEPQ